MCILEIYIHIYTYKFIKFTNTHDEMLKRIINFDLQKKYVKNLPIGVQTQLYYGSSQGDDQGCGSWIWLKLYEVLSFDK